MEQISDLIDFFEEPTLWQYSPSKSRMFFYQLKYASIVPVIGLLAGLILALTGIILWIGLILFGGTAVITFVITCLALSRQRGRIIYTITETKIIIAYPSQCLTSDFANIKKIKKIRSLFDKNVGTIKFKVKKGLSVNYQFAKIDNVDKVYDLLISLWEKHN